MAELFDDFLAKQKERMERAGVSIVRDDNEGEVVRCVTKDNKAGEDYLLREDESDLEKIQKVAETIEYGETYDRIKQLAYRLAGLGILVTLEDVYPEVDIALEFDGYNWDAYNKLLDLACNYELLQKVNLERELFDSLEWEVILPTGQLILAHVRGEKIACPNLEVKVIRHNNTLNDTNGVERTYKFNPDAIKQLIRDAQKKTGYIAKNRLGLSPADLTK